MLTDDDHEDGEDHEEDQDGGRDALDVRRAEITHAALLARLDVIPHSTQRCHKLNTICTAANLLVSSSFS